jgi:hypothetical protein
MACYFHAIFTIHEGLSTSNPSSWLLLLLLKTFLLKIAMLNRDQGLQRATCFLKACNALPSDSPQFNQNFLTHRGQV